MNRDPASIEWSQLRPGVIALVSTLAVAAAVFSLDVVLRELSEGPRIVVVAPEAQDLQPGADVWVAGVPAGRVVSVGFQPPEGDRAGRVVVEAVLREDSGDLLREDVRAQIHSSALLAPTVLNLLPGRSSDAFDPADTVEADPPIGRQELLARMEALSTRLERLSPEARRLAARLEDGPGTLASLRRDPRVMEELRGAAARMERLSRSEGTLVRLARDTAMAAALDRVRGRLSGPDAVGGAGLDRWSELVSDVARARARLDTLGARIEAGRGSAGRFLTDRELVDQIAAVRARMDSVRRELIGDPLRWLRFRLF